MLNIFHPFCFCCLLIVFCFFKTTHAVSCLIRPEWVNKMKNIWKSGKTFPFPDLMCLALQLVSGPMSCLQLNYWYKCMWLTAIEDLVGKLHWLNLSAGRFVLTLNALLQYFLSLEHNLRPLCEEIGDGSHPNRKCMKFKVFFKVFLYRTNQHK